MTALVAITVVLAVIVAAAIDAWQYTRFTHEDPTAAAIDALYPPSQKVHRVDTEDGAR